jgi:hypothetical protein
MQSPRSLRCRNFNPNAFVVNSFTSVGAHTCCSVKTADRRESFNPRAVFTVFCALEIRGDGSRRVIRSSSDVPSYKEFPLSNGGTMITSLLETSACPRRQSSSTWQIRTVEHIRPVIRRVLRLPIGDRKPPIVRQNEDALQQLNIGDGFLNIHAKPCCGRTSLINTTARMKLIFTPSSFDRARGLSPTELVLHVRM